MGRRSGEVGRVCRGERTATRKPRPLGRHRPGKPWGFLPNQAWAGRIVPRGTYLDSEDPIPTPNVPRGTFLTELTITQSVYRIRIPRWLVSPR